MTPAVRFTFRAVNTALGCWLAASAIVWPHSAAQRANTLLAGVAIVVLERFSRKHEWAHRATGLVGSWVVLSLFLLWPRPLTAWNNLVTGLLVATLSASDPNRRLPVGARKYRRAPTAPQ